MSKLTLTSEQRLDALLTVEWIRRGAPMQGNFPECARRTPGFDTFMHLQQWAEDLRLALAEHTKPAIKLRIRVGVTADGQWAAISQGCRHDDAAAREVISMGVTGPVVAWHWITAEVPMPEVERGEVAGEVEP